jgi:hypothetical protein
MDSQFNSLISSYNSNYVQYKITGNPSYQSGYTAAQQGLDSIISSLQEEINAEKQSISDFYKSGVEENLNTLRATSKKLQRGIVSENDVIAASKIRNIQPSPPTPVSITTTQYVLLGVSGALMIGLSLL